MDESVVKHLEQPLDEASRLLLDAAEYIERNGWCQHELDGPHGRVCMAGALYAVRSDKETRRVAFDRLRDSIPDKYEAKIPEWNDEPCRTQAEVVAKLRAVALSG